MNADLRLRCAAEIKRRLFPHTALTIKQLCYATGRSRTAVDAWLAGTASIKVEDLVAIARFLNDRSFLPDVFDLEKIAAPASDDRRRGDIRSLVTDAVRMALASPDISLWVTDTGEVREAPHGHAAYVRDALHLSDAVEGDAGLYAMRALGWLEITLAASSARIRYSERGVRPAAAERAASWLADRAAQLRTVRRAVDLGDGWAEAEMAPVAVAHALSHCAGSSLAPSAWHVTEIPADDIAEPKIRELMRAWEGAPEQAFDAAGSLGLLPRSSILHVDRLTGVVTSRYAGSAIKIPREDLGINLLARRDPRYGRCVADRARAALKGPTCAHMEIVMYGEPVSYDGVMVPLGRGHDVDQIMSVTRRLGRATA